MQEAPEKESGKNRSVEVINFEDYRITHPRNAPAGARLMRCMWGGEEDYQNYCNAYNELVEALKDCVDHGDITPDEAKERLEKCREF